MNTTRACQENDALLLLHFIIGISSALRVGGAETLPISIGFVGQGAERHAFLCTVSHEQ